MKNKDPKSYWNRRGDTNVFPKRSTGEGEFINTGKTSLNIRASKPRDPHSTKKGCTRFRLWTECVRLGLLDAFLVRYLVGLKEAPHGKKWPQPTR